MADNEITTLDNVKVYRLNDFDWWAGKDLASVKEKYLATTGVTEDEAFDEPYELTLEEMKENNIYYEEMGETFSFRQYLEMMIRAGDEFPCSFASTEA